MRNIKSKGTAPERLLAAELRKRKIYFSQYSSKIIGKPDFIFRKKKVLVFVDSDFWHGHPENYKRPKSNQEYWDAKVLRNRERDRKVNLSLKNKGWKVLRFWESDMKSKTDECLKKLLKAIDRIF